MSSSGVIISSVVSRRTARYSSQMAAIISSFFGKWYVMFPGLSDSDEASVSIRKSTTPVRLMISLALAMISSRVDVPARLAARRVFRAASDFTPRGSVEAGLSVFRGRPGRRLGGLTASASCGCCCCVFTCVLIVVWLNCFSCLRMPAVRVSGANNRIVTGILWKASVKRNEKV